MNRIFALTKKELKACFGSPMAAIFIGAFLVSVLFSFFWLETFFSRNIADIRPLFRWMPLLLVFLTAALTMRQWSEEQKMGTLEVLLTLPVRLRHLVLGKFLAVWALVGLALVLTGGLPLSVSLLGAMDWGPVLGGYLGAMLLAAAYIAMGLFVSSRTDNQIIALISTVLLGVFFYLLGSANITAFAGNTVGEFLRNLGTGSRFLSVERGVIDLRDVVYYASLTLLFLVLNIVSLAGKRWSTGSPTRPHRRTALLSLALVAANLLALNVWLAPIHHLRLDLTENREFSLSPASRDLVENLAEPLLLRGYFSDKTHPLLAPLVPRIRDLLAEYRIASGGSVSVEFIDPRHDEAAEAEANQQYGIKPVPFQVAGRYEAAVVNSYFNILVKYGDQHVVLSFNDLIEVRTRPDGQLEVGLRNLEYDLTRSIKKAVYGFQSLDMIFASLAEPLELTAVISRATLPPAVGELPGLILEVGAGLADDSQGKLRFSVLDPDEPGAAMGRDQVEDRFAISPIPVSIFSDDTFYLHLLLGAGGRNERIFVDMDMGPAEIRREVEAAIKRTSSGFLKTVGVWTPPAAMAAMQGGGPQYRFFQQVLRDEYNLSEVDLKGGHVPGEVDVLLLVAPQNLGEIERLAIDQYLMRGGSVVALAGSHSLDLEPGSQTLALKENREGIDELLAHYGVLVEPALVMDRRNEPFPIPVERDLGGIIIQEIRQIGYPFFVDVRQDGMAADNPALANLAAVTMNWVSPLSVEPERAAHLKLVTLLRSSQDSWLHYGTDIQPDFGRYPALGFAEGEEQESRDLAVSLQGSFASAFADRKDPRLVSGGDNGASRPTPLASLLRVSPDSSRLVVVGSSEFISDTVISIAQSMGQERILNNLGFLQNLIDWCVEDEGLLSIRARGSQARVLESLSRQEQAFWEWLNYGLALAALLVVSWYGSRRHQREKPMELDEAAS